MTAAGAPGRLPGPCWGRHGSRRGNGPPGGLRGGVEWGFGAWQFPCAFGSPRGPASGLGCQGRCSPPWVLEVRAAAELWCRFRSSLSRGRGPSSREPPETARASRSGEGRRLAWHFLSHSGIETSPAWMASSLRQACRGCAAGTEQLAGKVFPPWLCQGSPAAPFIACGTRVYHLGTGISGLIAHPPPEAEPEASATRTLGLGGGWQQKVPSRACVCQHGGKALLFSHQNAALKTWRNLPSPATFQLPAAAWGSRLPWSLGVISYT